MKDNNKHYSGYSATLNEAYDVYHKEMKNKRFMKRATEKSHKKYLESLHEENDEDYLCVYHTKKGKR